MNKGLEALENLYDFNKENQLLKQAFVKRNLDIIEQELKALEIIKEKRVDVHYLQECKNLKQYNDFVEMNWSCRKEAEYNNEILTQEEYDLLKEVLL